MTRGNQGEECNRRNSVIVDMIVPLLVALIGLGGAIIPILVKGTDKPKECHQSDAPKVCVDSVEFQTNNDEPQLVKQNQRRALNAGNRIKLLDLKYCIPPQVTITKLEIKGYLFQHGIESYKNVISTPSTFSINSGCYHVGNFQPSWTLKLGQHQVRIVIIKYDGSTRVVDKDFGINLDVGE